jgi:hypothetical protein
LVTDVGDINKKLTTTTGKVSKLTSSAKSWGSTFSTGFIGAVGTAITDSITDFQTGERLATQLGNTWKNLGLDGSQLAGTMDTISDSALRLGVSDDEAFKVFNNSIKTTNNAEDSMRRLGIAWDLVASGSAPDLASAMKIVDGAANGSKRVMDKFGLSGKTAGDRLDELGGKVAGAADQLAKDQPFRVGMNAIGEAFSTIAGVAIVPILEGLGKVLQDTVVPAVTDFSNVLKGDGDATLAARIGVLAAAFGALAAIALANPLLAVGAAIAGLGLLVQVTLTKLNDGSIKESVTNTGLVIGDALAEGFGNSQWKNTPTAVKVNMLDTITSYVTGWFKNNLVPAFRTGWNNMVNTVLAPFQRLQGLIQTTVGFIRDVWNSLDFAIPAFDFSWGAFDFDLGPAADALGVPRHIGWGAGSVHIWDGTGDLFPDIGVSGGSRRGGGKRQGRPGGRPGGSNGSGGAEGSHAGGLWSVPFDEYPARLHAGEMVVPSDFAEHLRGGMGGGGNTYNITLNAPPTMDLAAAGKEIVKAIKSYEQRDGKTWRAA